jgi:hypothetical protein
LFVLNVGFQDRTKLFYSPKNVNSSSSIIKGNFKNPKISTYKMTSWHCAFMDLLGDLRDVSFDHDLFLLMRYDLGK